MHYMIDNQNGEADGELGCLFVITVTSKLHITRLSQGSLLIKIL